MNPLGTRPAPGAALRHELREDYRRFDQKRNMIYQGEWNPAFAGLSRSDLRRAREEKLRKGLPGFTRLDWAYQMAATANSDAARFVINLPDAGGTSWTGIARSAIGSEAVEGLPEYGGSPAANARILKKMARLFGADDTGISLLDRRWVYSRYFDPQTKESYPIHFSDEPGFEAHREPGMLADRSQVIPAAMKYVLVFIHGMDYSGIAEAPTLTQMATTLRTYSQIAATAISLAEFIRGLGYRAIPSANCTALNIPLAIDAGLGELGRNAKLLHPRFGPRCRISKVITDLPLAPDTPLAFGVTAFCDTCKKCARTCPGGAIPTGERSFVPAGEFSNGGFLQWQVDHDRCKHYQAKVGTNCGICLKTCPYNKPAGIGHWLVKSTIATTSALNRLLLMGDDLAGYGRHGDKNSFWEAPPGVL
jgi:reductive dehalogenase